MSQHRTRLVAVALMAFTLLTSLAFSARTATAAVSATNTASGNVAPVVDSYRHVRPNDNWWQCLPGNGSVCDNTDPFDTGCAATKVYVASYNGTLDGKQWQAQLYYSTGCQTVWSRLQLISGTNGCYGCELGVEVYDAWSGSYYAYLSVGSASGTLYSGAWTNQLYITCGGPRQAYAKLWRNWTVAQTSNWYPGC